MVVFSGELHIVSRVVQKKSRKQCRCSIFFLLYVLQFRKKEKKGKWIYIEFFVDFSVLGEERV
jgi:intergrase/recombinase